MPVSQNETGVNCVKSWRENEMFIVMFSDVLHRPLILIIWRCCFTKTAKKWTNMQNARAKHAELLFLLIKPISIVLWCSRNRWRRPCLSSLMWLRQDRCAPLLSRPTCCVGLYESTICSHRQSNLCLRFVELRLQWIGTLRIDDCIFATLTSTAIQTAGGVKTVMFTTF